MTIRLENRNGKRRPPTLINRKVGGYDGAAARYITVTPPAMPLSRSSAAREISDEDY